jgi:hypothetical protein
MNLYVEEHKIINNMLLIKKIENSFYLQLPYIFDIIESLQR